VKAIRLILVHAMRAEEDEELLLLKRGRKKGHCSKHRTGGRPEKSLGLKYVVIAIRSCSYIFKFKLYKRLL